MKGEGDDIMNYESMITKLSKGNISEKAASIKKLLFLYENARSRIYLYERRIVESLELSLLIEEKEISLNALSLLEKILANASSESQISNIFRKRLLSKVVLNLGSADVNVRKVSHKCVYEYIRKFKDYETIVMNYLKSAIRLPSQTNPNTIKHLKLKAISSLYTLIMAEPKWYSHEQQYSLLLIQELISSAWQKQFNEIRRVSLTCLLYVLRLSNSEIPLKQINEKVQSQLYQLSTQSEELAMLLDLIMKYTGSNKKIQEEESAAEQSSIQRGEQESSSSTGQNNAPSPKFISIQESEVLVKNSPNENVTINHSYLAQHLDEHFQTVKEKEKGKEIQSVEKIPETQMKIFNQISYAEDFLKMLESSLDYEVQEVKGFAPYLEKYLIDESIKLFSISKKIVEVIFDSKDKKQFYVVLVPCVVNGIGNKRFIVRKNLDKLVRQYAKNYTEVWIENFIERFAVTNNTKLKQMLIDLFIYSYKSTSPEFYYPTERPFEVFDFQINNKNSNLKWKAIDCVVLMIERQGKSAQVDQMLKVFSLDSYNKIIRKLNKNSMQIMISSVDKEEVYNEVKRNQKSIHEIEVTSPVSSSIYSKNSNNNNNPSRRLNTRGGGSRKNRLVTDQPQKTITKMSIDTEHDNHNVVSEQKMSQLNKKGLFFRERRSRKSHIIDYEIRPPRRRIEKRSIESIKDKERTSLQKLPQLRGKQTSTHHSVSKNEAASQSPVKKSFTEKNIMYVDRSNLQELNDPKAQLQKALSTIKSNQSWMLQFESINILRSIVEHHVGIINQGYLNIVVTELLNCLNNLRSGVMKISLICLDQLIQKVKKRLHQMTEVIVSSILKKSVSTSEFIADELRKCICICVEEFCTTKIIAVLQTMKETKNAEIKINILLMIETMVRCQSTYKKQTQWIWMTLIDIHDEPQFQLRLECKRIVKVILELYKGSWKKDVIGFKKYNLQKIDKILKNLNQKGENSWLQQENIEFQKIIVAKGINSKFFTQEFSRFQQTDRHYLAKKNWKERIRHLNDTFQMAFNYPEEFQSNLNAKKYILVVCEHLDQKNPGLLVNALGVLQKCIDVFQDSCILQECLGPISQKYFIMLQTRRVEMISIYQKLMQKIYKTFDPNQILKEYIKISINSTSMKVRAQALNQLSFLIKEQQGDIVGGVGNQSSGMGISPSSISSMMNPTHSSGSSSINKRQRQEKVQKTQKPQKVQKADRPSIPISSTFVSHKKIKQGSLKQILLTGEKHITQQGRGQGPSSGSNSNITGVSYYNNNNYNSSSNHRMMSFMGSQTPNAASQQQAGNHHNIHHQHNVITTTHKQHQPTDHDHTDDDAVLIALQQQPSVANMTKASSTHPSLTKYNQQSQNMLVKMINKLLVDKLCENSNVLNHKIKDVVIVCNKRFGENFSSRIVPADKNEFYLERGLGWLINWTSQQLKKMKNARREDKAKKE